MVVIIQSREYRIFQEGTPVFVCVCHNLISPIIRSFTLPVVPDVRMTSRGTMTRDIDGFDKVILRVFFPIPRGAICVDVYAIFFIKTTSMYLMEPVRLQVGELLLLI